jgi:2-polyprenyl-6-methoxyphenol hydroxylase-like FAD-dependent oxidoreductase
MTDKPGSRQTYDAVVVGARCAGAATALLLARAGQRVLVVDRGQYGTDTLSTHALMRGGVLQLQRWGVLDRIRAAGTPSVTRTTFHYGDEVLDIPIKARDGVDALYAPRRTVLDRALVDAAREAGAEIRFGTRLVELLRAPGGRVCGVTIAGEGSTASISAQIVVGADGMRSTVARMVGAEPYRVGRHATGVVYGYWSGVPTRGYHWYYRERVSAGAISTNDDLTCVFAAVPSRRFRDEIARDVPAGYHRVLRECDPSLAESVGRAALVGHLHGFPGEPGYMRQSQGAGWALVGDAGYFKDPLTAHGITDALRDAELLARAILQGTDRALPGYQEARNEMVAIQFQATDDIASFEWDLTTVRLHHRIMVEEMTREVKMLNSLPPLSVTAEVPRA